MRFDHMDREQGDLSPEYAPHFEGQARMQRFAGPFQERGGPAVFFVHFDAGGRTKPHIHHTGQVLHIAHGEGIVANEDGRRTVRPGDVVVVEPGEWHWHGGTPSTPMSHLTVQMPSPDDINWDVDERDWASGYQPDGSIG